MSRVGLTLYLTSLLLSTGRFLFVTAFLVLNDEEFDVQATVGDDVVITCNIDNDSRHKGDGDSIVGRIRWFRDVTVELGETDRIFISAKRISTVESDDIQSTLTIKTVSPGDAGNYTCCKRYYSETCHLNNRLEQMPVKLTALQPATEPPTPSASATFSMTTGVKVRLTSEDKLPSTMENILETGTTYFTTSDFHPRWKAANQGSRNKFEHPTSSSTKGVEAIETNSSELSVMTIPVTASIGGVVGVIAVVVLVALGYRCLTRKGAKPLPLVLQVAPATHDNSVNNVKEC